MWLCGGSRSAIPTFGACLRGMPALDCKIRLEVLNVELCFFMLRHVYDASLAATAVHSTLSLCNLFVSSGVVRHGICSVLSMTGKVSFFNKTVVAEASLSLCAIRTRRCGSFNRICDRVLLCLSMEDTRTSHTPQYTRRGVQGMVDQAATNIPLLILCLFRLATYRQLFSFGTLRRFAYGRSSFD